MAFEGERARYYLEQARRVRELADSARDMDIRYEYQQLAEIYERLAATAGKG